MSSDNQTLETSVSKIGTIDDGGVTVIKNLSYPGPTSSLPDYNDENGEPLFDVWQTILQNAAMNPELGDVLLPRGTDIDLAKAISIAATLGGGCKVCRGKHRNCRKSAKRPY